MTNDRWLQLHYVSQIDTNTRKLSIIPLPSSNGFNLRDDTLFPNLLLKAIEPSTFFRFGMMGIGSSATPKNYQDEELVQNSHRLNLPLPILPNQIVLHTNSFVVGEVLL